MEVENKEKYEKIIFSIRMLKFHSFITERQFGEMLKKLQKLISKENEISYEKAAEVINSMW